MREGVTLITPTSDRPLAFSCCERWMARQTYRGPLQWIVADDGGYPACCTLGQTHIRRPPSASPAQSFCGNLIAALERVEFNRVLFIEDDDWYHPEYIARQLEWLDRGVPVAGEGRAKYYHVGTRQWFIHRENRSIEHASLCQTGIHGSLVPWLLSVLKQKPIKLVDKRIWLHCNSPQKSLMEESKYCIGIKGLPGKSHLEMDVGTMSQCCTRPDPDGDILRSWIGEADGVLYNSLMLLSAGAAS